MRPNCINQENLKMSSKVNTITPAKKAVTLRYYPLNGNDFTINLEEGKWETKEKEKEKEEKQE